MIAGLIVVLGALIAVGSTPSARLLLWVHKTPRQALQQDLDSSLRTAGVEATVTRAPAEKESAGSFIVVVDVPSLTAYDKTDPYRVLALGIKHFPGIGEMQVDVNALRPDGTVDNITYLWDSTGKRVQLFRESYALKDAQRMRTGFPVGFVAGMTPEVIAKVVAGGNAPKLTQFPAAAQ